ncbi:MAG: hypothetical protein NW217_13315 [Hyphomicrobiaceae bacterium]|nr:hypothetical protein [Hyphomicrobiaceae bacterium]
MLAAATVLGPFGPAAAQDPNWGGWGGGPCGGAMMGPGMMHDGMMGSGMMMGQPGQAGPVTVEDVQRMLELNLQMYANPNLKVGTVSESNGTITAEIVTKDGSLVNRFQIDRASGRWTPSN